MLRGVSSTLTRTDAERVNRDTLRLRRQVLGPDDRDTLISMNNLGNLLCVERRYSEAEQLLLEARATELRNLGPKAPETAATTYNLACLSALRGKRDQSLGLLQEAVDNGLPARVLRLIATDPDLN